MGLTQLLDKGLTLDGIVDKVFQSSIWHVLAFHGLYCYISIVWEKIPDNELINGDNFTPYKIALISNPWFASLLLRKRISIYGDRTFSNSNNITEKATKILTQFHYQTFNKKENKNLQKLDQLLQQYKDQEEICQKQLQDAHRNRSNSSLWKNLLQMANILLDQIYIINFRKKFVTEKKKK